ncbi:MAK10-like protein [Tanacetum coccineum]
MCHLCHPTPSDWCKMDVHSRDSGKGRACVYFNFPFVIKLAIGLNVYSRDRSPLERISQPVSLLSFSHREELPNLEMTSFDVPKASSWNDLIDLTKPVKAISLPQDVPSTSDHRFIELENQVQCLMEAHIAHKLSVQQAFVDYTSSHTDKAGGLVSSFMASQDARLSKFEADFKQPQSEMTNRIDTFLEDINDQMMGALLIDTVIEVLAHAPMYNSILDKYVKSLELRNSKPFDTLANLGSCMNLIPLYLFKNLKFGLLEETKNVLGLVDGTMSYTEGIVKDVEVYVGKLKPLEYFYVIDMEKDPTCPLVVGRGFLATTNTIIDCKKYKIVIGEGITGPVFRVREAGKGQEDVPYYTTIARQKSYNTLSATYKTPIGMTPYKLLYGKTCHLPFKIEHRAYWALKNCYTYIIAAGEKCMFQL